MVIVQHVCVILVVSSFSDHLLKTDSFRDEPMVCVCMHACMYVCVCMCTGQAEWQFINCVSLCAKWCLEYVLPLRRALEEETL